MLLWCTHTQVYTFYYVYIHSIETHALLNNITQGISKVNINS